MRRRLLTALLARPGAVVPVDGLLDAAWGDDPPASAERTLQSHLARLREVAVSVDPTARVDRADGGYRLVVESDLIDAVRFERLVDDAGNAPPGEAVVRLREALALWRGPAPYADLQHTAYPAAEAARLTEERGAALETLSAALLESGDPVAAAVEAEVGIRLLPYREALWEVLVVALYRQGRQGDALAAYQRARRELDEGLGVDPGPRLRELESRVLQQDASLLVAAPAVRHPCPYKGLARYDARDAGLFVGRERLVEELVARLVDARFLVVVGPSGAGKSSLVRAGLVPALTEGALPGSETWHVDVVLPGTDPVAVLSRALDAEPDLLVVDQAEEALLAADGASLHDVGDGIVAAIDSGVRIVLALRADFFGRLAEHPALARRVGPATVLVGPPDDEELRRIVIEPAARVGLRVEPALADLVVREVRGRPGALPVLSTALVRTWEQRDGESLTVASYRTGGGVEAALQRVGEEAWAALESDEERAACRRMLLRLAVDEEGSWVRRRARRSEVAAAGDAAGARALSVLSDRRIVVASADDVEIAHEALLTGWPRLLGWLEDGRAHADVRERLSAAVTAWAEGGRDATELYSGARLHAALDTAAAAPDDITPLESEFLAESSAYADRQMAEQVARADREARGRRRTRAVAAGLAAALLVAAVTGGLAVHQQQVAAAEAEAADAAALHADATRLGAQALAHDRYDLSLLLAAQAYTLEASPQTKGDLLNALAAGDAVRSVHDDTADQLVMAPDGLSMVSIESCGLVQRWPLATIDHGTSNQVFQLNQGCGPRSAAFTPNGQIIAGELDDVVDVSSGRPPSEDRVVAPGAWALSPDGRSVLGLTVAPPEFFDYSPTAVLFPLASPTRRRTIDMGAQGVWASRCGAFACVTTSDSQLLRLRFTDGKVISRVRVPGLFASPRIQGSVEGRFVASPTGDEVAPPFANHLVELVDPATGAARVLPGTTSDGAALAFSPDGRTLAGRDGRDVLIWNLDSTALPIRLTGHGGRVHAAVFTPDGSTLITSGEDQAQIVWDLSGRDHFGRVLTRSLGDQTSSMWASATRVAVGQQSGRLIFVDPDTGAITRTIGGDPSPNGIGLQTVRSGVGRDEVIAVSGDGLTTIWSASTGKLLHTVAGLPPKTDAYGADAWVSRDGTYAATIRDASGVRLIDMVTGKVVRTLAPLPPPKDGDDPYTIVMGFTTDGAGVIVARQDYQLFVFDTATGKLRAQAPIDSWPEELAADPHGRYLVAGGDDSTLHFYDPATVQPVAPVSDAKGLSIINLSVSPDGRWFSTSDVPPHASLWDVATRQEVGGPLPIDADVLDARARFTADNRLVVASGNTMRIYSTDPTEWLARACREAGRTLTSDEWATYLPNRHYDPACATSGAPGRTT